VRTSGSGLTNGLVTVVPDPSDGTFSVTTAAGTIAGLGRIVDDGDAGDTYNWSPPIEDRVVDRPDLVEVAVGEAGPVRGHLDLLRTYRWPAEVRDGRRVGAVDTVVRTRVELRAGEDLVRVSVTFEHRSADHRVRIWFPLPERATSSEAECAFGTVHRGLTAEGGPNEVGVPTFPSRRFVRAGGVTVAHEGLLEYELVDVEVDGDGEPVSAGAIAITLLRAVGVLSAGPMAMRPLPAGPSTPTPAAQLPGPHRFDLVLHVGDRDPAEVADDAFTPILVARFPGGSGLGDPEASGQALAVGGAEVTALCRRPDGRTEIRVVNAADEPAELRIDGRSGDVTDLLGRVTGERFDGRLPLRPHQIATIALD
jgi:alpha-mannosidase